MLVGEMSCYFAFKIWYYVCGQEERHEHLWSTEV